MSSIDMTSRTRSIGYMLRQAQKEKVSLKAKRQRGAITLLEVLTATIIGMLVLGGMTPLLIRSFEDMRDGTVAGQMSEFTAGAQKFVQDHFSLIAAAIPVGSSSEISFARLRDGCTNPCNLGSFSIATDVDPGYIDTKWRDTAGVFLNAYEQQIRFLIRRPNVQDLEFIVATEGGRAIPETRLPMIAARAEHVGGFISERTPTVATGAYNLWSLPLAAYGGYTPAAGRLVFAGFLMNGGPTLDWLSRRRIPSNPNSNRMEQNINMNGFDITGIGPDQDPVTAGVQAPSASEAIYFVGLYAPGEVIQKPVCRADDPLTPTVETLTPRIFLTPVAANSSDGQPLGGYRVFATDNGTNWTINFLALMPPTPSNPSGWVPLDGTNGRLKVELQCAP